jgi:post-segregation antitoxin (ccd killing protein)
MKQNITLAVDNSLLKRARALAAQRGASMSAMLAQELLKIVERENAYQQAKLRALARLNAPFHLGGGKLAPRESLHDRQNLR